MRYIHHRFKHGRKDIIMMWKGEIGVTGYGDLDSTFWINVNSPYDLNLDFVNTRSSGNLTIDYDAWVLYKK